MAPGRAFRTLPPSENDCDQLLDKEATLATRREVLVKGTPKPIYDIVYKDGRIIEAKNVISLCSKIITDEGEIYFTPLDQKGKNWDLVAKEPTGKLSLTNLEDGITLPVTKQSIVDYIHLLVSQAIHFQKARWVDSIKTILKNEETVKNITSSEILDLAKECAEGALTLLQTPAIRSKLNLSPLKEVELLSPNTPTSIFLKKLTFKDDKEEKRTLPLQTGTRNNLFTPHVNDFVKGVALSAAIDPIYLQECFDNKSDGRFERIRNLAYYIYNYNNKLEKNPALSLEQTLATTLQESINLRRCYPIISDGAVTIDQAKSFSGQESNNIFGIGTSIVREGLLKLNEVLSLSKTEGDYLYESFVKDGRYNLKEAVDALKLYQESSKFQNCRM